MGKPADTWRNRSALLPLVRFCVGSVREQGSPRGEYYSEQSRVPHVHGPEYLGDDYHGGDGLNRPYMDSGPNESRFGQHDQDPRRGQREYRPEPRRDRKSTRLNSSHVAISYAGF